MAPWESTEEQEETAMRSGTTTAWTRAGTALAVMAVVVGLAPAAHAYADSVHAALPRWMFPQPALARRMPPVAPEALPALRNRFYALASHLSDVALRQRFLARYPSAAGFDAAAFKEFLALNPQATVWGLDQAPTQPQSLGAILSAAAAAPDRDERNQSRLWRSRQGRAMRLADGSVIPVDPMVLSLGRATGVTSQAHAHYGLAAVPKSEDPSILKADPRRFAMPASIETYAAANAQLWTDMAILAGAAGQPTLAAIHEGAWQHFAADVANQVHTVQVGIYEFFVDAKVQSILDWFWGAGGLLHPPAAFRDIGITIVANHHLLSEFYFMKRMDEVVAGSPRQSPRARQVLAALGDDDAAFRQDLLAAGQRDDWAAAMVGRLIELSSHEGADLYRVTRGFAQRRFSQVGVTFDYTHDDPDACVRPAGDADAAAALTRYYALYESAFRRTGTIARLWQERYRQAVVQPGADQAAVARIVKRQLDYWQAADTRRTAWLADKTLLTPPSLASR
jgi:hypothetical protein